MFIFSILILLKISLSIATCIKGENHCFKCNPLTKLCAKCELDIYVPNENGGCDYSHKCILGISNCLDCNESGNLCNKCIDGYYPDENGGCSYTENCEISYKGKCLKCKDDFILIGEDKESNNKENEIKICKSLYFGDLKNCEIVNNSSGLCEKCREGFYLNTGDKKCSITNNCYESIFNECIKCNDNYYLDKFESKCKSKTKTFENCKESLDGKTCEICDEGYFFDDDKNCINVNYCSKGIDGHLCQKCVNNYFLSKNDYSCTNTENCYIGDKELGICMTCIDGYYIDFKDGKCKPNTENNDFKYCKKADSICIECLENYELGKDNKCSNTKNCAESINGKCIQCTDNYHLLLDNKCSDIEHCIYSDNFFCTECEDNYYYDITEKNCKEDEGIFKNCKSGYSNSYCQDCKNNYYLNYSDYLCYSNQELEIFYKCKRVSTYGNCSYCFEGYYLGKIDKKCSKIQGCAISENGNNCIECDTNYYCLDESTGKCEMNHKIINEEKKFYFRCNKTNKEGTACSECNYGFILNEKGLCIDNVNCEETNEDGSCKKCKNDLGRFCLNNIFGCYKLYGYAYCLECNNIFDFYNCTKCYDGYTLNSNGFCNKNN